VARVYYVPKSRFLKGPEMGLYFGKYTKLNVRSRPNFSLYHFLLTNGGFRAKPAEISNQ